MEDNKIAEDNEKNEKSHFIVGFECDRENAIIEMEKNTSVKNSDSYRKFLNLFSIDKLKIDIKKADLNFPDGDINSNFLKQLNKQLQDSPFYVKQKQPYYVLEYKPPYTLFILINVLPGSNMNVVAAINDIAISTRKNKKYNFIKIAEVAVLMGGDDIIVKIEASKKKDNKKEDNKNEDIDNSKNNDTNEEETYNIADILDSWIIKKFQTELRKKCRDKKTSEPFVKTTRTLRVMRDLEKYKK